MICLRCGDCCHNFFPVAAWDNRTEVSPCQHLVMTGNIARCAIQNNKPDICKQHTYPSEVCPIGLDILDLPKDQIHTRIKSFGLNNKCLYCGEFCESYFCSDACRNKNTIYLNKNQSKSFYFDW